MFGEDDVSRKWWEGQRDGTPILCEPVNLPPGFRTGVRIVRYKITYAVIQNSVKYAERTFLLPASAAQFIKENRSMVRKVELGFREWIEFDVQPSDDHKKLVDSLEYAKEIFLNFYEDGETEEPLRASK